jgi:hypothetical protein
MVSLSAGGADHHPAAEGRANADRRNRDADAAWPERHLTFSARRSIRAAESQAREAARGCRTAESV